MALTAKILNAIPWATYDYWTVESRGVDVATAYMTPAFIIFAFYVPAVFLGQRLMKYREPFKLKWAGFIWNLVLSLLSGLGAAMILYEMPHIFKETFVFVGGYQPLTRAATTVFAVTKGLEFGDTAFLVLRKRPVILLHWYHHLTVAYYSWHALYALVPYAHYCCEINLIIHFIMYGYYAAGTVIPRHPLLRALRPYITGMQTVQMFVGMWFSFKGLTNPHLLNDLQMLNTKLCLVMYTSYAYLFSAFYIENYRKSWKVGMGLYLGTLYCGAIGGIAILIRSAVWKRLIAEAVVLCISTSLLSQFSAMGKALPTVPKTKTSSGESHSGKTKGSGNMNDVSCYEAATLQTATFLRSALMALNCTLVWAKELLYIRLRENAATENDSGRSGGGSDKTSMVRSLINKATSTTTNTAATTLGQSSTGQISAALKTLRTNPLEYILAAVCVALPAVYTTVTGRGPLAGVFVLGCLRWVAELHISSAFGLSGRRHVKVAAKQN